MSKGADVIDTCVLILGIEHMKGTAVETVQAERAYEYMQSLEEAKVAAIVPSVVVAELLTGVPAEEVEEVWEYLEANFIVAPFDGQAAVLSARAMHSAVAAWKENRNAEEPTRYQAKVDGMIVGVAAANSAARIVSFNLGDFKRAGSPVPVSEPPQLALAKRIEFGGEVN